MQPARSIARIECYGSTIPQQGKSSNEDAFLVGYGPIPCAVLCDGAGNAQLAAKRALALFEKLLAEANAEQVQDPATWSAWIKLLDSSLLGGNQSTFVGLAVVEGVAVGACAGDSKAYLLTRDGELRILTDGASKSRLGSGKAEAFPIRHALSPGEIFLLLSDGAWTPLSLYALKTVVQGTMARHFSEVSTAIIEAAGRTGRADDMTAVTLRLAR
jgi:serine/threonine protein phosphatase PrpC